ncbi:MAG TPA: glycosyltransferase family 25 protein [Methylocystis sp.]|jgi:GR25 family glycosyltransferase involved in LPS biosynthesis
MRTFVISLARTPERLAQFRAVNGEDSGVETFAAVDGSTLSWESLVAQGVFDTSVQYTKGAVGNALSHLSLWQRVLESGEAATICEDDAILPAAFRARTAELLGGLDPWDIVLWGWNFDSVLMAGLLPGLSNCALLFDQDALRKNALEWRKGAVDRRLYKLYRAFGMVCYSISPRGAERLLRYATPVRETQVYFPILNSVVANRTLDVMANGAYSTLDAFVSFPPLALTYNDHARSTVNEPAPPAA